LTVDVPAQPEPSAERAAQLLRQGAAIPVIDNYPMPAPTAAGFAD
jgi:hypothetical protein